MSIANTLGTLAANLSLCARILARQNGEIAELRAQVAVTQETLESFVAARESDYVYAMAARRIRDYRLPWSRAEASLMWMYVQWRRHGDAEECYEPMPEAALEAADRRREAQAAQPRPQPAARRGRWSVQG